MIEYALRQVVLPAALFVRHLAILSLKITVVLAACKIAMQFYQLYGSQMLQTPIVQKAQEVLLSTQQPQIIAEPIQLFVIGLLKSTSFLVCALIPIKYGSKWLPVRCVFIFAQISIFRSENSFVAVLSRIYASCFMYYGALAFNYFCRKFCSSKFALEPLFCTFWALFIFFPCVQPCFFSYF